MAGLEIGKCGAEDAIRGVKPAQDKREARPGVSASASQEREASDCIAGRAYAQNNRLVKWFV